MKEEKKKTRRRRRICRIKITYTYLLLKKSSCKKFGGHLASVHNVAEDTFFLIKKRTRGIIVHKKCKG